MSTRIKNYFKVYQNGKLIGTTCGASLKEAKSSVRNGQLYGGDATGRIMIGTHMGEWRRLINGYVYRTTTGVTLEFVRFGREATS